jgi:putative SOS response-associated peptidase YedK
MMRWGLIPSWVKDTKIGNRMINARAETVREKSAFKRAYRALRLIVPASGFYEWKRDGKHKQPFAIHRPDGAPLAFAVKA